MIPTENSAAPASSDRPNRPLLLRGGTILTMDSGATVHRSGDILIRRGRIAFVGRPDPPPETRVLDISGCIVLPGLVQGHLHLGQTFFRGLAEQRRLLEWLRERIWPFEAAHDDESAYWCGMLGAAECLLGGTTTIQDIGLGPGIRGLLRAITESGLRAYAGPCLMDSGEGLPDALRQPTDKVLAEAEELGNAFDRSAGDRLRYVLNPRFILSCSDTLWDGVRDLSLRRGWPVHTHALEQKEETRAVREMKEGRDEIEYFADRGLLGTDLRLAHGVWLTKTHLSWMRDRRVSVVHCPSSNLKLGSGIADLIAMRRFGVPVGIGCDGAACSNHLDSFEELRLAALLQKVKNGLESFTGLDALRLATSDGARALGLQDETGSLEPGKFADLVILSTDRPELWAAPQADPHDLVAFGASRAAVRHVFVEGRMLVRYGQLTRLDLPQIVKESNRCLAELIKRSGVKL